MASKRVSKTEELRREIKRLADEVHRLSLEIECLRLRPATVVVQPQPVYPTYWPIYINPQPSYWPTWNTNEIRYGDQPVGATFTSGFIVNCDDMDSGDAH